MPADAHAALKSALPPGTGALVGKILEENPLHRKFLNASVAGLMPGEIAQLEEYIGYCLGKGLTVEYLSACYLTIVFDTLREQAYFQKNGAYRCSTFAEVADRVYFDEEYMSHYMYGLALTSFLWPNHLAMFRFFRDTLPKSRTGAYLEIGPGHGYFITTAMELSAFGDFLGIDISETSIAQTGALVAHYRTGRPAKNLALRCMDFLNADLPDGSFDAVVMGEVLEHVERPDAFLKRIRALARDDAHIFVTTCINAPAVDHIYLFRDTAQLEKMFADCGLGVKNSLVRPYEGKTLEESVRDRLAVNVAYVLEKT